MYQKIITISSIIVNLIAALVSAGITWYIASSKNSINIKKNAYENFYLLLIQFIFSYNQSFWDFDNMIFKPFISEHTFKQANPNKSSKNLNHYENLINLLALNLKYIPQYLVLDVQKFIFTFKTFKTNYFIPDIEQKDKDELLEELKELFNVIMPKLLEEASLLSKKLKYPDIAKAILEKMNF